jgi:hypothetical protein
LWPLLGIIGFTGVVGADVEEVFPGREASVGGRESEVFEGADEFGAEFVEGPGTSGEEGGVVALSGEDGLDESDADGDRVSGAEEFEAESDRGGGKGGVIGDEDDGVVGVGGRGAEGESGRLAGIEERLADDGFEPGGFDFESGETIGIDDGAVDQEGSERRRSGFADGSPVSDGGDGVGDRGIGTEAAFLDGQSAVGDGDQGAHGFEGIGLRLESESLKDEQAVFKFEDGIAVGFGIGAGDDGGMETGSGADDEGGFGDHR